MNATENVVLLDRRPSGSSRQMMIAGEGKGNGPLRYDTSKQCRNVGSSSIYRGTDSKRLGRVNPLNDVSFRKSTMERSS